MSPEIRCSAVGDSIVAFEVWFRDFNFKSPPMNERHR